MSLPKCLIVDVMHPSIFPLLEDAQWQFDYQPEMGREEIQKSLPNYQGLIIRSKTFVDRALLGEQPTLKFIGRAGAGLDNLDLGYLQSKNIAVLHAGEGNRDAVGEYTVGILLSLLRKIPKGNEQVRNMIWDREGNRGEEIMNKTVSIIGYGNMGKAFAQRLRGFGCKILVYDKYKRQFADNFVTEVDMETIFRESDIVSLHIPLTDETRMMVNEQYFNRFAKNIVFINTARGEIVSLSALVAALRDGKVRSAGLDVLENEKLNQIPEAQLQTLNYLKAQPNVIFTPHIAGWTFESHEKINVALVNKIKMLRPYSPG
ncbi:MAG TPA: NAD(P)-dependent oxidoreductase [Chryseosolibacter sp.]|nr:NAD(P)-dependent oxidoreductase [Chryseosolibacter sp.]